MKIRNKSKKVIGNQDYILLPGESMEVKGDELWVSRGISDGMLEKVADEAAETVPGAADASETVANAETEKPAAKAGRKTAGK